MQLINQGAEGKIYKTDAQEYFDLALPYKLIVKERARKRYRIQELDKKIVLSRTLHEAKLLHEAKNAGVATPTLFFIDRKKHALVMEFISGERVKEMLQKHPRKYLHILSGIGEMVGRLHSHGIVHGDLTTSNIIIRGSDIVFIDFGLGEFSPEVEKQSVDLHLFKQALKSTHFKNWKIYWRRFTESYIGSHAKASDVIERIKDIEKRGRYIQRGE